MWEVTAYMLIYAVAIQSVITSVRAVKAAMGGIECAVWDVTCLRGLNRRYAS